MKDDFLQAAMGGTKVGAAIRRPEDLDEVLGYQHIKAVFLLGGDVNFLPPLAKKVREAGNVLLVHIDLMEGIGKDAAGALLLKRMGAHGIVTTRAALARQSRELGLYVVQRFFIVDSESLRTALKVAAGQALPDAVEVLPATVPTYVVEEIKKELGVPVLGGGLLRTVEDAREALSKGFDAISTSRRQIWQAGAGLGLLM
ncbi:MAG: glycerol-3-phosphate responsive antiterminator [Bacillota bacterium]